MARRWSWQANKAIRSTQKIHVYIYIYIYIHENISTSHHVNVMFLFLVEDINYIIKRNLSIFRQLPSIKLQVGLYTQKNTVIDEPTEINSPTRQNGE